MTVSINALIRVQVPIIGCAYHLSWANKGCIWMLVEINGDKGKFKTKSNKIIESKLSDMLHTRETQKIIENKELGYLRHIKLTGVAINEREL